MSDSLGSCLRALRESAGLTLRDVESDCHVSNGYLSLLEHDKIKEPSPKLLWALAQCYTADYIDLMRRAGYPIPTTASEPKQPIVVFRGAEKLTPTERTEIQQIIKMKLRLRQQNSQLDSDRDTQPNYIDKH